MFSGEHLIRVSENKDIETELLGSWTTSIGPVQDQASEYSNHLVCLIFLFLFDYFVSAHIWKYEGYRAMQSVQDTLREDKVSTIDIRDLIRKRDW